MSAGSIRSSWLGDGLTCRAKRESGANSCIGPIWLLLSNEEAIEATDSRRTDLHITKKRCRQDGLAPVRPPWNDCPDGAAAPPLRCTALRRPLGPRRCQDNGAAW